MCSSMPAKTLLLSPKVRSLAASGSAFMEVVNGSRNERQQVRWGVIYVSFSLHAESTAYSINSRLQASD